MTDPERIAKEHPASALFSARASRRQVVGALAAAGALAGASSVSGKARTGWDVIVVGAGVFGAWTAWNLQRKGNSVLLLDAWGAAQRLLPELAGLAP